MEDLCIHLLKAGYTLKLYSDEPTRMWSHNTTIAYVSWTMILHQIYRYFAEPCPLELYERGTLLYFDSPEADTHPGAGDCDS